MTSRLRLLLPLLLVCASGAGAQSRVQDYASDAELRAALASAQADGKAARLRAEGLEAQAAKATRALEKTEREAAGIAARIQQAEARLAAHEAQIRLIDRQRQALRLRLAERQRPLVRLTAALQRLSRRPPVLSLLRPGSVADTMHMRAVLDSMLPEISRRTAALRAEIARGKVLQEQARLAMRDMRAAQADLRTRRKALDSLETRQRLASRSANSVADREAERALALAEQARDLDGLSDDIARAGATRQMLARLPGPVPRPARPQDARVSDLGLATTPPAGLPDYVLPVSGRLIAGFGDASSGQPRSRGIALATRPGAQAIAPGAGRVVFAGPYRGFGRIVMIEHPGGWISLVTGLAQLDTRVGESLVAGSPLGITGTGQPVVSLELRRDGTPVNPLDFVSAP